MKKFIRVVHSIIWWIDWIGAFLIGMAMYMIFWQKDRDTARKAEYHWAGTLMTVGGIKLDIEGQDNLPDEDETVVYMVNHQSDLDWPIIFRAIPGQYLFVAKQELFSVPIFGAYMKMKNYIPINRRRVRSSLKTFQNIIGLIKSGESIVIYPEGTRSYNEELQKFKSFSFAFLQEAKVRVVPVAIGGSMKIIKKGSLLMNPGTVKVTILPPISFNDLYDLDTKQFCSAASSRVREPLAAALQRKDAVSEEVEDDIVIPDAI